MSENKIKHKEGYIPGLHRRVFTDPVLLIAFGFGFGLSKKAPGTFGTLPGIALVFLLYWAAYQLSMPSQYIIVLALVILAPLSVRICGMASEKLGVHDYGGIVLDEVIGIMIPFTILPVNWLTLLIAFIWFRFFDALKPWPISWMDRNIGGGFGIVFDDVAAGLVATVASIYTIKALSHFM